MRARPILGCAGLVSTAQRSLYAEVGRVMELKRRTVRTHLNHTYRKLGVNSHVDAMVMALKAGIVEL